MEKPMGKQETCECPPPEIPKQGISFGGNLNIPGHTETTVFKMAQKIKTASTSRNAGLTKFYTIENNKTFNPPPINKFR